MLVLGVDPGLQGSVVIINEKSELVHWWLMPDPFTATQIRKLFQEVFASHAIDVSYLEQVGSSPGFGAGPSFTFGKIAGMSEMCLAFSGVRYQLIRPASWQKAMHRDIDKTLNPKVRSLIAFERLWPEAIIPRGKRNGKPHDGIVDAALIAEAGRREMMGEKETPLPTPPLF